jgi:aarF domain-containing kinase
MRPPLPAAYDASAIAAHYYTAEGAAALRGRVASISVTVVRALVPGTPLHMSIEALGPSVIKFGQALANRPDLVGRAIADDLRLLQDSCTPFALADVQRIIREDLPPAAADEVLAALPERPAAAASLGQVYRLSLPSYASPVALKLLRPGARETIAMDSLLARAAAGWLQSLRWPPTASGARLLKPALVAAVDEFFSRLFEEMDYANERANLAKFGALYRPGQPAARALAATARRRRGEAGATVAAAAEIVLPQALPGHSGGRCLAMTWVEGEPLLPRGDATLPPSSLPLVRFGIDATLSQMLEEGVMHADPHGGNLLRAPSRTLSRPQRALRALLRRPPLPPRLAYLDFGLVSEVPLQVREIRTRFALGCSRLPSDEPSAGAPLRVSPESEPSGGFRCSL